MLRDLIVHLEGDGGDKTRLAYAERICTEFQAHLTGVFLNISHIPTTAGYAGFGAAEVLSQYQSANVQAGDKAMKELKERFEQLVSIPHELRRFDVLLGEATGVLCSQMRTSDLLVTTRPYGTAEHFPELVEAAIFDAGSGVLLAPPELGGEIKSFDTIMVSWRDTKEAARAVFQALAFLQRAKKVVVVMVDDERSPEQFGQEPGADISRHLSRHNCNVQLRHLRGESSVSGALLAEAEKSGAGMIVMGAYGHSRIREWVLGGVTRDVMSRAAVPILTAH